VPAFSAFTPFGALRFSSRPSHGEQIYREMVKSLGSGANYSDDFDGLVAARLYMWAMALGRCKYEIERLGHQWDPRRSLEGLPVLERELGIVPERGSTIAQRRAEVVVASRIARGGSRSNVEAVLAELFGADFIAYVTTAPADAVVWPAAPADVGVYDRPGSPRGVFETLDSVIVNSNPVAVRCQLVAGEIGTMRSGRRFVIDSGNYSRTEAVEIQSVSIAGDVATVTATFTNPHSRGVTVATGRQPNQATSLRHNLFVMSPAAAADAKKRRRLHKAAHRLVRGISTWSAADDSGPFQVSVGRLGITTIGAVPGDGIFGSGFDDTFE
jgi:hypothetical protein